MSAGAGDFRAFDHSRFAGWPEYAALARALDNFAHRCDHETTERVSQSDFEQVAVDVARHLIASDCCVRCMHDHDDHRPWAPVVNRSTRGTVEGLYRCDRGHVWRCAWADRASLAGLR